MINKLTYSLLWKDSNSHKKNMPYLYPQYSEKCSFHNTAQYFFVVWFQSNKLLLKSYIVWIIIQIYANYSTFTKVMFGDIKDGVRAGLGVWEDISQLFTDKGLNHPTSLYQY